MSKTLNLRGVEEPEIVFGLVGALGTPINNIVNILKQKLAEVSYQPEVIHLSKFLSGHKLHTPEANSRQYDRLSSLMSRGNELREQFRRGDALAMHATLHIFAKRKKLGSRIMERQAFILRQLKHQDEVSLLRNVYGDGFHLIGIYTPENIRIQHLSTAHEMTHDEVQELLIRDAGEEHKLGQQVAKTFHLSDLFVDVRALDDQSFNKAKEQISRYIDLLFGKEIITPTIDEQGMFLAYTASLRSADLSRQVGAAILSDIGDVISIGANEVPKSGGGQYWGGENDDRDFARGYDSNEKIKIECVEEILAALEDKWEQYPEKEKRARVEDCVNILANKRLMNLTEFGRSVHAEMEAILSASRLGISVRGHALYVTTFPCHNCAKHIVGSGIKKVVYVEPYSKSLADRLHGDAISFSLDDGNSECKISFQPFEGVSWRRYVDLFAATRKDGTRIRRKRQGGDVKQEPIGLRIALSALNHVDREAMVAGFLSEVKIEEKETG